MHRSFRRLLVACLVASFANGLVSSQAPVDASANTAEVVLFTGLADAVVRPVLAPFEAASGYSVKVIRASRRGGQDAAAVVESFRGAHADVWWSQEALLTDSLKRAGAFERLSPPPAGADGIASRFHDPDGTWFGFAARGRIVMVNTEQVPEAAALRSMWDLIDPKWMGKVAVARPTSGTALFHFLVLRQSLGEAEAARYLDGLLANQCVVVASDSRLAELIGRGEVAVGMTDTNDFRAVQAKGMPVRAIWPDQDGRGALVIPNTLAALSTSANPQAARRLVEYLLSADAERLLAELDRGQIPLRPGVARPANVADIQQVRVLDADFGAAAALAESVGPALRQRLAPHFAGPSVERPERTVVVDFDAMPVGAAPIGMSVAQTGAGALGVWSITPAEAGEVGNVLVQTDATPELGSRFPLCIVDGVAARDVSVDVRFKTMTGDTDRAAGLCVRVIDADNYYCCRVNSLEDNYRFYKVVDGRRIELAGVNRIPILEDTWQSMRLDANGSHFRMWLNGTIVFEADDDTFPGPGKVGLWLKGDSVTAFDDFVVSAPGERVASDFESEALGSAPRGFSPAKADATAVPWHIVEAPNGAAGRRVVTPVEGRGGRAGCVLLADLEESTDASIAARFKVATEGPGMHLAGLVARYRGADDHYYLRINLEECNIRLYRVTNGRRVLIGERHHTTHDDHVWHTVRMTLVGRRFEVAIDDVMQFSGVDTEAPTQGRIGVWAVPGGGTLFDQITVDALGGR